MAPSHQAPEVPSPGNADTSSSAEVAREDESPEFKKFGGFDTAPSRVLRLRLAPWDVVATIILTILLVVLVTTTNWPSRLFGFLADVCTDDTCAPAPFGIDFYIYPVVWGGIGAAFAAVIIGPLVSLVKGWYMSFWPVLAMVLVLVAALAGSAITALSNNYWHDYPGAPAAARILG